MTSAFKNRELPANLRAYDGRDVVISNMQAGWFAISFFFLPSDSDAIPPL